MEHQPHHQEGGELQDARHADRPSQELNAPAQSTEQTPTHVKYADLQPAEQRARDRQRLEHYVEAGLHDDDAQSLVEFEHFVQDERARQAAMSGQPGTGPTPEADDQTLTAPDSASHDQAVATVADEHQAEQTEEVRGSPAHQRIREGIEAAKLDGRQVDDRIARDIARQFKTSDDCPLAAFIACGAIWNDDDGLHQELYSNWQQHTPEQQEWAEALRTYCASRTSELPVSDWCRDEAERGTRSGIQPEIWVVSLTDYNNGLHHGMWIDADQEPEEIQELVGWILRTSPTARSEGTVAEEWGIFDHSGFCGYEVSEWSSFDTVSLVGKGIAEHGEAYAAWVDMVGDTSGQLLEDQRFQDAYLGRWDSLNDYVEDFLQETGFYQQLETALATIPEDLRRHIKVDVKSIAEEWQQRLHVVEAGDGGVFVFGG